MAGLHLDCGLQHVSCVFPLCVHVSVHMALEQRRLEKEGSQCNLEIRVQWENRRAEDSRPGSIFSGPLVLPLRLDSMIAPGLRGDYGLCWAFGMGNEACGV